MIDVFHTYIYFNQPRDRCLQHTPSLSNYLLKQSLISSGATAQDPFDEHSFIKKCTFSISNAHGTSLGKVNQHPIAWGFLKQDGVPGTGMGQGFKNRKSILFLSPTCPMFISLSPGTPWDWVVVHLSQRCNWDVWYTKNTFPYVDDKRPLLRICGAF